MLQAAPTYAFAYSGCGALGAYWVGVLTHIHRNIAGTPSQVRFTEGPAARPYDSGTATAVAMRPGGLRFHTDFISRLVELGESDAAERHEQLRAFFVQDRPQRPSRFEATQATSV